MSEAKKIEEIQLLTFEVDKSIYGIDIDCVKEIIKYSKINKIPGENENLLGVIMPRDVLIKVIDLKRQLFSKETEPNENDFFIVCNIKDNQYAFPVTKLNEIIHVNSDEIIPPNKVIDKEKSLLNGLVNKDNNIISILDIKKAC